MVLCVCLVCFSMLSLVRSFPSSSIFNMEKKDLKELFNTILDEAQIQKHCTAVTF